jgi:hypothetical protein
MTKSEFQAIKARTSQALRPPTGAHAVMIICEKNGRPIHPDTLGPVAGEEFKRYCAAVGQAVLDREALMKFIADGFEIEWAEDATGGKTT